VRSVTPRSQGQRRAPMRVVFCKCLPIASDVAASVPSAKIDARQW
jgi:hypothetical protein